MKILRLSSALLLLLGTAAARERETAPTPAGLLTGREIMARVRANRPERGYRARVLLWETKRGRTLRRLRAETLMHRGDGDTRFLYRVLSPLEEAGTTLLVIEPAGEGPTRYFLRLPGEKAREMRGADLATPFAGTRFSLQDFGFDFVRWPDQRVVGLDRTKGIEAVIVESRPPPGSRNPYAWVRTWIARKEFAPLRCEAYDEEGRRVRRIEIRSFDPINHEIRKLEARTDGDVRTVMQVLSVQIDREWPAEWFTVERLDKPPEIEPFPTAPESGPEVVDTIEPLPVRP